MEEGMTLFEINSNPFYWGMHAYVKIKYDKIGRVVREKKRVLKCHWFFFTIFLILPLKMGMIFISRNLKSLYLKKLCTNLLSFFEN